MAQYSEDFRLRLDGYSLVTVNVIYYRPDARSILNEFTWQTLDLSPKYPRIEKFLDHWRREIDAVIKDVLLSDPGANFDPTKYRNVTGYFGLQ